LFITGGVTAYLDLFLTPFVSFGIITIIILCLEYDYGKISDFCKGIWLIAKCAVNWLMGYLGLWLSKWIIASLIMKHNILLNALNEVTNILNGKKVEGVSTTISAIVNTLILNLYKLFPVNLIWILKKKHLGILMLILVAAVIGLFTYWIRHRITTDKMYIGGLLIIVAITPYLYYIIMHFHTYVHYWAEFRYQTTTVMALCLAYMITTKKTGTSGYN
jgi:hypothetical protein